MELEQQYNTIKLEKVNESYVRIITDTSIMLELRDKFSFMVDGYRFNPRFQYGSWDGKICMIQKDLIPLGLVDAVKAVANNYQYDIEIDDELKTNKYFTKDEFFKEWIKEHPVYDKGNEIEPYWYQQDAIRYGIDNKRCILNLPTSAGKSLIQGMLSKWFTETFTKNILILVPTVALTDQMESDFINYDLFGYDDINIVRGGSNDVPGARVTVGTWQSIVKRGPEFMEQFGMLLVDECFKGNTPIKTPNGYTQIKNLKPGDIIYSMNEDTGEIIEDKVIKLHENLLKSNSEKMLKITLDNDTTLEVTANHQFMTHNRGWVRADELTADDDIIIYNNITKIKKIEEIKKPEKTYNLHVEQNHNYFANDVLAKNCHLSTGTTISNIVKSLINCEYKIGLSGSLKDGKANSMSYVGLFGSTFAPVSTRQLADEGFIADLDIKMLFLKHDQTTSKLMKGKQYADEIKYLTNSKPRMNMLCGLADKLAKQDKNVLLLFKHIAHGKAIYEKLCDMHGEENVEFVDGSTKREKRSEVSNSTEDKDGRIIVASYGVFSTGISIKKLHHVILSHPVKSKIIVIQSIGRLLRKHESKDKAQIWDLVDDFTYLQKNGKKAKYRNYALKHGLSRMQLFIDQQFSYKTRQIEL